MSTDSALDVYQLIGTPLIFKAFPPRTARSYYGSRSHF